MFDHEKVMAFTRNSCFLQLFAMFLGMVWGCLGMVLETNWDYLLPFSDDYGDRLGCFGNTLGTCLGTF